MYCYSVNNKKYNVAGICTFRNERIKFFENLSRPTVYAQTNVSPLEHD